MIGVLAAIKSMTIRAEKHSLTVDPKLRMELGDVKVMVSVGHQSLASLETPTGNQRQVLVEWLKHDTKCSKEDVGEKLFSRIESITEILSSANQTRLPAVLQSCGFFHDPAEHAFGQVYNVPSWYGKENTAISLRGVLVDHRDEYQPALQDRFKIAHTLASALLIFHKIGWLHRAPNASNIIFFPPRSKPSLRANSRSIYRRFHAQPPKRSQPVHVRSARCKRVQRLPTPRLSQGWQRPL